MSVSGSASSKTSFDEKSYSLRRLVRLLFSWVLMPFTAKELQRHLGKDVEIRERAFSGLMAMREMFRSLLLPAAGGVSFEIQNVPIQFLRVPTMGSPGQSVPRKSIKISEAAATFNSDRHQALNTTMRVSYVA
jgi:hypothetical protein